MVPDRLWNRTECVVKGLSVLTYRPGQLPGRASVLLVGSCSVLLMGPVQGFKMVPCTKSWLFEGPSTFLAPWFVPGPFRILELAPFRDLAGLESTTPCHIYSTVALIVSTPKCTSLLHSNSLFLSLGLSVRNLSEVTQANSDSSGLHVLRVETSHNKGRRYDECKRARAKKTHQLCV
jgi:hypothetical protein